MYDDLYSLGQMFLASRYASAKWPKVFPSKKLQSFFMPEQTNNDHTMVWGGIQLIVSVQFNLGDVCI